MCVVTSLLISDVSQGLVTVTALPSALSRTHLHAGAYRLAGKGGNSVFQKVKEKGLRHKYTHTYSHTLHALLKTIQDVLKHNKKA